MTASPALALSTSTLPALPLSHLPPSPAARAKPMLHLLRLKAKALKDLQRSKKATIVAFPPLPASASDKAYFAKLQHDRYTRLGCSEIDHLGKKHSQTYQEAALNDLREKEACQAANRAVGNLD